MPSVFHNMGLIRLCAREGKDCIRELTMKQGKQSAAIIGCCVLLLGAGQALSQDWPQWRGPNRDNKIMNFAVPKTWPKELTKKWRVTVGPGEASPLLVADKVYVFTRAGGDEVTLCLEAATG